jgi:hypothetical protein
VQIGEVAASAAGDEDLSPWLPVVFEQRDSASALTSYRRAHQPSSSRAQDDYIELACFGRRHSVQNIRVR